MGKSNVMFNRYVTFDHIVPRSHGGSDFIANLRLAHQSCNRVRGCDPILPEHESRFTGVRL